ncbi:MAG: hypothetical protein ABSA26_11190 [Thermoguttaceae bacterium]
MEFQQRLQKAIERGQRASFVRAQVERDRTLNEKELQRLHTQYRLELSERIERCLKTWPINSPASTLKALSMNAAGAGPSAATI